MLLRNCRLIPELSGDPGFTLADVEIEGEIIKAISPAGGASAAVSSGETYDCKGNTLMSGLFDLHAHISIAAARETPLDAMKQLLRAVGWFGDYLKHGVTTIRDCGSSNRMAIPLRDAVNAGTIIGPDVIACGYMLGPRSMYTLGKKWTMTMAITEGHDKFYAAARRELSLGADFIKIYASPSGSQALSEKSPPILSRQEVRAAVEAARSNDSYVAAHAHSLPAIELCLEEGVRCIEHGTFLDASTAKQLSQMEGIYLTPTLAVLAPPGDGSRTEEELEVKRRLLHTSAANIRLAYESGIHLGFGTDLVNGRLTGFYNEFLYRSRLCGMSNVDILLQATKYSAEIAGLAGIKGELKETFIADMILVEGRPDKVLSDMNKQPLHVWKRGRIVI